jgi:hypothetical protein
MNKNMLAEKGTVLNIQDMINTAIIRYRNDLNMLVDRMNIFPEDYETINDYYNTIVYRSQNNLNAVALTSIAIAYSLVKGAFVSANKDTFSGYQWISIIDGKTSDYCIVRHLKYWYFNSKENSTLPAEEYPPGHYRCRSGISYIFQGDTHIQAPTYEQWFEQQDEKTKKDILGQGRYKLYTNGNLEIDLMSTVSGQKLTLEQLRNM